jgi:hypothetical protein
VQHLLDLIHAGIVPATGDRPGVFEDKAVKNIFACEHVTHSMARLRTVGVISEDDLSGITEIADPVG